MTAKQLCKITAFLLIGLLLFFPLQEVFLPDWNVDNAELTLSGFADLEKNSLDVLFLGPSHVGKGISPLKIYEDTGIRSYNLGTSGQSVATSYFLLEHAFKTQNPNVVFLDASSFFDRDIADKRVSGFYRYVMDNLYLTETGMNMAMAYDQITGNTGVLSAILPMSLYHTRWTELTEADFTEKGPRPYYSMGLCMMPYTAAMDEDVQAIYQEHLEQVAAPEADYCPELSGQAMDYFERILQLCEEKDALLILMKVPSIRSPYDSGWNDRKSQTVAQMAQSRGVMFYDLGTMDLYDPETDTSDGKHLNIRGAEKISAWLGAFLAVRNLQPDTWPDAAFEDALEIYRMVRDVAMLQSETDFLTYLNRLAENRDRWSFAVAGYGDFVSGLTQQDLLAMQELGLEKIADARTTDTYAAVIRKSDVLFEERSDRHITWSKSGSGWHLSLSSASKLDAAVEGRSTTISFNNTSAGTGEGLLFLIWDNETGLPIDSKSFATGSESRQATCSSGVLTGYLRQYEAAVAE